MIDAILENFEDGVYQNHKEGFKLFEMDLRELVDYSLNLGFSGNEEHLKRIEYLEQRENDLMSQIEYLRKTTQQTPVTENKKD
jgi:hypothetical protein